MASTVETSNDQKTFGLVARPSKPFLIGIAGGTASGKVMFETSTEFLQLGLTSIQARLI